MKISITFQLKLGNLTFWQCWNFRAKAQKVEMDNICLNFKSYFRCDYNDRYVSDQRWRHLYFVLSYCCIALLQNQCYWRICPEFQLPYRFRLLSDINILLVINSLVLIPTMGVFVSVMTLYRYAALSRAESMLDDGKSILYARKLLKFLKGINISVIYPRCQAVKCSPGV